MAVKEMGPVRAKLTGPFFCRPLLPDRPAPAACNCARGSRDGGL